MDVLVNNPYYISLRNYIVDDSLESLNLISKSLTSDEVKLELVRCKFEKTLAIHFPGFIHFIVLQFHHDNVGSINDS